MVGWNSGWAHRQENNSNTLRKGGGTTRRHQTKRHRFCAKVSQAITASLRVVTSPEVGSEEALTCGHQAQNAHAPKRKWSAHPVQAVMLICRLSLTRASSSDFIGVCVPNGQQANSTTDACTACLCRCTLWAPIEGITQFPPLTVFTLSSPLFFQEVFRQDPLPVLRTPKKTPFTLPALSCVHDS